MKTASTLIVAFLLTTSAQAQLTYFQWPVATGGNGHSYALTPSGMDWVQAEAFAVSQGGHLASITSAPEQSFLNTTFLTGAFDSQPLWVGLADQVTEGQFQWTTGEPLSYVNWHMFEPNDGVLEGEDYVAINWHRASGDTTIYGDWNDLPVTGHAPVPGPYFGVIEVVPEPASWALLGLGALGLAAVRRLKRKP